MAEMMMRGGGRPGAELIEACLAGDVQRCKVLLQDGVTPDVEGREGITPLMDAVARGDDELAQLFLLHGADSGRSAMGGRSVLYWAVRSAEESLVEAICSRSGVDVDARLHLSLMTPLHVACMAGSLGCVAVLVQHGADVNAVHAQGGTPLLEVLLCEETNDCEGIVAILLNAGASVNAAQGCMSPLHCAVRTGQAEPVLRLLLDRKANVDALEDGDSPLMCAACSGNTKAIQMLLDAGASLELTGECDKTALVRAIEEQQRGAVELLLSRGANASHTFQNKSGRMSALSAACDTGDWAMCTLLMEHGANPFLPKETCAFLHVCRSNELDILERLINRLDGATKTYFLRAGFQRACQVDGADAVEVLIRSGLDVEDQEVFPLCCACDAGSSAVVSLLLQLGANTAEPSAKYDSLLPLELASRRGSLDVAKALVGNTRSSNSPQWTRAAAFACSGGHESVVRYFIEKGLPVNSKCDPSQKNDDAPQHQSLVQIACDHKEWAIVHMLVRAGADVDLDYADAVSRGTKIFDNMQSTESTFTWSTKLGKKSMWNASSTSPLWKSPCSEQAARPEPSRFGTSGWASTVRDSSAARELPADKKLTQSESGRISFAGLWRSNVQESRESDR